MAKKTTARRSRPTKAARSRSTSRKPARTATPRATPRQAAKPAPQKGKWVYAFGGGKGANLAEMANLGLPVPPGFTITTDVCTYFYAHDKTYPKELKPQVEAA